MNQKPTINKRGIYIYIYFLESYVQSTSRDRYKYRWFKIFAQHCMHNVCALTYLVPWSQQKETSACRFVVGGFSHT